MLQNARQYFSPHEAVAVIRQDILKRHPETHPTPTVLGGIISEEEMQKRNYKMDGNHTEIQSIIREFLRPQN